MTTESPITQTLDKAYVMDCDLCVAAQTVMNLVIELPDEPHYESLSEAVAAIDIDKVAKDHSVPLPLLKRRLGIGVRRTQWTPTMVGQFKADVDEGLNAVELAKKWGMSKSRVNQVIAEHDIDVNPGRRARLRRDALQFQQISDAVLFVYDLEPDLSRKAIHAWVVQTQHELADLPYEKVSDVITRLGIVTGDLDALPNGQRQVVDGRDEWVEDHPLPEQKRQADDVDLAEEKHADDVDATADVEPVDDVVTVRDRTPLDWMKMWLEAYPRGTIEDYAKWAEQHEGAPSTTDIRHEFGGWGKAKAAASA